MYKFILLYLFTYSIIPHASAILLLKPDTSLLSLPIEANTLPITKKSDEGFLGKKNQTVAFVLAILLGWLGFHDFYSEKMTKAAIKFVMGTFGLFLSILIPPLGFILLLLAIGWALFDAYSIYNNEYEPEDGWDIKMK